MSSELQWASSLSHQPDHAQLYEDSFPHFDEPQIETYCDICRSAFLLDIEVNNSLEGMPICRECKTLVFTTFDNTPIQIIQRRPRSQRSYSSESIEDLFSHQFSQMVSMSRQNQHRLQEDASSIAAPGHGNTHSNRSSRRWRRPLSDTDSESMYYLFGESDTVVSMGGNGSLGENDTVSFSVYEDGSDISVDRYSSLDQEVSNDDGIYIDSETDINPMQIRVNPWNTDFSDSEWEETDANGERQIGFDANVNRSDHQNGFPWRFNGNDDNNNDDNDNRHGRRWDFMEDILDDFEETGMRPFIDNSGDYLDARGFEQFLLEQFAETESLRRGPPPTAVSFIQNLLKITISKEHEKNDELICAICKDPLAINTEANELPCHHLYHPSCILPWLKARNSCPVCRFELPTDDKDYNDERHILVAQNGIQVILEPSEDVVSLMSDDSEENESFDFINGGFHNRQDSRSRHLNRVGAGLSWLYVAAAPILAGIAGVALISWIKNHLRDGRAHRGSREHGHQQLPPQHTLGAGDNRNKRWWSLFSR